MDKYIPLFIYKNKNKWIKIIFNPLMSFKEKKNHILKIRKNFLSDKYNILYINPESKNLYYKHNGNYLLYRQKTNINNKTEKFNIWYNYVVPELNKIINNLK